MLSTTSPNSKFLEVMKTIYPLFILIAANASAATSFIPATGDFNTVGNWDDGLPDTVATAGSDDEGIIPTGTTANMSASYQTSTGRRIFITVNGTLNTGANELQLRSGSQGTDPRGTFGDLIVDGGTLNVASGGRVDIAGIGADLFVDGGGTVNFLDGSTIQASKAIEILNGTLVMTAGAISAASVGDELVVGDAGTLAFGFDGAQTHFTFSGATLALELGATSTLDLSFAAAPTTGSVFTLVDDISAFSGEDAGTGTGVFGTINATGLGVGQSVVADYGVNTAGELQITIVPEPSSAALLGLGSLALILRRRK